MLENSNIVDVDVLLLGGLMAVQDVLVVCDVLPTGAAAANVVIQVPK